MIEHIIVAASAIVIFVVAIIFVGTSVEESKGRRALLSIALFFIAGILIAMSTNGIGIEESEGLPVGSNVNSIGYLPPENIPWTIKTADWEKAWDDSSTIKETHVYLTLVSYNNINGTRTFYKISWSDIATSTNLSKGETIINNNGIIQQAPS